MKNRLQLKIIFYSLVGIFVLLLAYFFVPFSDSLKRSLFPMLGVLGFIFLVFGIVLVVISKKESARLRLFLRMTGISAILPFVFSILHNLFYGLAVTFENFGFLFEPLHVASFLISIVLAPILFVVGAVGIVVSLK